MFLWDKLIRVKSLTAINLDLFTNSMCPHWETGAFSGQLLI